MVRRKTHSVDETLHPGGSSSVSDLVGGDVDEDLSESGKRVERTAGKERGSSARVSRTRGRSEIEEERTDQTHI